MFPVGSSDLYNMLVSFVLPCLCFFLLKWDVWVRVSVYLRLWMQRSVHRGDGSFHSYQCVCAHAFFPSMHGLSLCIRQCICDVSVFPVLLCAVDFGVEPAFCLCFWCVSVVFVYCGCSALACLDWTGLNSQGWVCQRFLLHPSNTADNLDFFSVWWMRDYLSAIRLLGNLSQTPGWFPLSLLPLALMSNSESYFSDLHIAPKLEHQSVIGKRGDIWSNEMGWTHLSKDEDNSAVLKWKSPFLWPLARQTIWSIVFPLVMLLNACALKICIFLFFPFEFFECVTDIFVFLCLSLKSVYTVVTQQTPEVYEQ